LGAEIQLGQWLSHPDQKENGNSWATAENPADVQEELEILIFLAL
jgi:hypothetical protein